MRDKLWSIYENELCVFSVNKCELFSCSGTCTDEPEELTFHRTPLSVDQDQQTYDAQQRQSISLGDLGVTLEKAGMTYWVIKVAVRQTK